MKQLLMVFLVAFWLSQFSSVAEGRWPSLGHCAGGGCQANVEGKPIVAATNAIMAPIHTAERVATKAVAVAHEVKDRVAQRSWVKVRRRAVAWRR